MRRAPSFPSTLFAPVVRFVDAVTRPFTEATQLTRAHVERIHHVYRVVLPGYALVGMISTKTLWVRDPALAATWSYTCLVALVGSWLLMRAPEHALRTMRWTVALLVLGFLGRVAHSVAFTGAVDINLQSVTAPLVAGAIVSHTVFAHEGARRFNQILATLATTVAVVGLSARSVVELDHVLSVVRFALCAFGMIYVTEFMSGLQREYAQLRSEHALMERLALCDSLTTLPNRRACDAVLAREVSRARRHGGGLSVLLVDLDAFKAINDRFGHEAGDAALSRVASVLKEQLRTSDAVARWAGDEFLVVLPETALDGALIVGERLRAAVAQSSGRGLSALTISLGAAAFEADGDDVAELVRRADRGLYRAKELGRNRVAVAPAVSAPTLVAEGSPSGIRSARTA